jgi:hypothetical protein
MVKWLSVAGTEVPQVPVVMSKETAFGDKILVKVTNVTTGGEDISNLLSTTTLKNQSQMMLPYKRR